MEGRRQGVQGYTPLPGYRAACMNVFAIIQARMSSTRLPGKSLAPIAGRPLLGHVLDRARACETVTGVMLATSDAPADQAILDFAQREKVTAFAGSEQDVLDRFFQAASR